MPRHKAGHDEFCGKPQFYSLLSESDSRDKRHDVSLSASATLTERQQNQPFMVNALLSVVVYFV